MQENKIKDNKTSKIQDNTSQNNKSKWQEVIREAQKNPDKVKELQRQRMKYEEFQAHLHLMRKILSWPITIGAVSSIAMYYIYGWKILLQNMLSWVIGITIVAAFVSALLKPFEKQKNS